MEQANFKKTVVIFGAIHIFIFLVVLPLLAYFFMKGTGGWEAYIARMMLEGHIPYHPFVSGFEYPPLALLSFLLPGLITTSIPTYAWLFAAEMMVFDLLALVMIADLASRLKISVRNTLAVYTLLIVVTGPILVARYDVLPATLVLAALWAFARGKNKLAWAVAALGFATKLYPIIILPIFVIYQLKNRQYGRMITGGAVFLGVTLLVSVPWVIIDGGGYWHSWTYHLERGLHAESTYGTALLTGQLMGLTTVQGALTFGSWNLSSPLADNLAKMSFYISAAILLVVYGIFAWRLKRESGGSETAGLSESATARLLKYATIAVAVFLLTNKVFSAQYLAWLCPLIPLVADRRYFAPMGFIAAAVLTQYVYPYQYISFELGKALPVLMLTFRNLLLILMTVLIAVTGRIPEGLYQTKGNRALRPGG
jgi:uncharacterized membrane protein